MGESLLVYGVRETELIQMESYDLLDQLMNGTRNLLKGFSGT